jgi:hypothetical protein
MRCCLQIPDPEMRNPPGANRGVHISDNALTTPINSIAEPRTLQERRLSTRFFLTADVAATIARLHFGEARA